MSVVKLNYSAALRRPELLKYGWRVGNNLHIDREEFNKIKTARTAGAQTPWPVAVKIIARRKTPEDSGVGDTAARLLGGVGEKFKLWFFIVFGKSCGCDKRQEWLNNKYRYT